ncbi:HD domain-containing protein [Clostridium uliginosum]|uniref:Histidine kinase-, DNA gyrase B-, and HSP90-like ATPase n=1 Tax=Clostridium uliginosum TaxID=119641 RepID=A0A1I1NII7_9CLOT|nr:ATP-binding protein [Clostridium uliginosum]SFC97226.1 Histidine kinase-, DNA gyrase B-, and HSP90-like ATPase [Clostridium uliginosum]
MATYYNTKTWQRTLGTDTEIPEENKDRNKLITAYENFREKAKIIASEIARDQPDFTVHDINHIDALWEMTDLIIGNDYNLTPAEAFVLGGAFLIHDLGMGLAAYPDGIDSIKNTELWKDIATSEYKKVYNKTPTEEVLISLPDDINKNTLSLVLRQLHAKHAKILATIKFGNSEENEFYLIEDQILRNTYGEAIGLIAHSHWLSVSELKNYFPNEIMGAATGLPNEWIVDLVKIACILRVADASHLDERRAPANLRIVRNPNESSENYWIFQGKMLQPIIQYDRIVYTSKPFKQSESEAWWIGYDTLKMLDRELKQVDALLADKNKHRFLVRSVAYIDEPTNLSTVLRSEGWEPVDTQIRVGDVVKLVAKLGGEQLYGNNVYVPIRELIQNAMDAIRARRMIEDESEDWGNVNIEYGEDSNGYWIKVTDNGVGMSKNVLTGPFLDFGTSFWGTELMHDELPGLECRGFESIGRYGIGFFSTFMIGNYAQVRTRRYEESRDSTLILEFNKGLTKRPILRKAERNEQLREGGTSIKIYLKNERIYNEIIYGNAWRGGIKIERKIPKLCPSSDVTIYIKNSSNNTKVITANDWIHIDERKFFERLAGMSISEFESKEILMIKKIIKNFRIIKNESGEVVGRLCIYPTIDYDSFEMEGTVTIGGFESSQLRHTIGILKGTPCMASRMQGKPIVESKKINEWATEQAQLINKSIKDNKFLIEASAAIRRIGGHTGPNPVARNKNGYLTYDNIISLSKNLAEVILVIDATVEREIEEKGNFELNDNVIYVEMSAPGISNNWPENNWDWFHSQTLCGLVIEALAEGWNVDIEKILNISEFSDDDIQFSRNIGHRNGITIGNDFCDIIYKPRSK